MDLYQKDVLEIFRCNFPFDLVDTPLGLSIEMPPREAFLFSVVTGSGYLDNPIYPFTPKGLLKLFYNAFDYSFVTGIFENLSFKHTPYLLSKAKKYLFEDDFKYIVPIEFYSEVELQNFLNSKFQEIDKPEKYLILRIEVSKKGNGMEPLMEYFAAEYFKSAGFIVENQIPLAHSLGSPDFGGYSLKETLHSLTSFGLLPKGFHIIELALIRIFKKRYNGRIVNYNESKFIVGEAKTSTRAMNAQLNKYLETNLFDFGFEIHPSKVAPSKDYLGLLTLNQKYELTFIEPQTQYKVQNGYSKEKYEHWLTNYMKFYVLANLSNDEFNEYFSKVKKSAISSKKDIVEFVESQSMDQILEVVTTV